MDIVPTCCSPDNDLCDLKYQYTPAKIKMINTGATWRMDFSPDGSNLSGGPLDDDYKVPQEEETGGGGESEFKLCERHQGWRTKATKQFQLV